MMRLKYFSGTFYWHLYIFILVVAECGTCKHGFCSAPGVCTCHSGYQGVECDTCIPNPDCKYGTCRNNPFECDCYDGFEGLFCHKPKCREGCHPEHVRNIF